MCQKLDYSAQKWILENLEKYLQQNKETLEAFLFWFFNALTCLKHDITPGGQVQVPPPHMLAFYLVNGL